MKQKIKIIDNVSKNKKTIESEYEIRNYDHLLAQIKYPHRVFRDKTKYSRKEKHKGKNRDSFL